MITSLKLHELENLIPHFYIFLLWYLFQDDLLSSSKPSYDWWWTSSSHFEVLLIVFVGTWRPYTNIVKLRFLFQDTIRPYDMVRLRFHLIENDFKKLDIFKENHHWYQHWHQIIVNKINTLIYDISFFPYYFTLEFTHFLFDNIIKGEKELIVFVNFQDIKDKAWISK